MMSPDYGFLYNKNLPSEETIVAHCQQVGYTVTGTPLLDPSSKEIIAWIKFGPNVTVYEAQTQDYTAKALANSLDCGVQVSRVFHAFTRPHPACTIGYIAMEYIEGADCDSSDVDLVEKAVQTLIGVQGPSRAPGHVGGGPIVHSFFLDWISAVDYKSVEDLDAHINNILKHKKDPRRVNIVADAEGGLFLCPCDINPGNFRKCKNGKVFAMDFSATCFMPPSFVGVAMKKSQDPFCREVAKKLTYTQSDDVSAIVSASYYLVQFGHKAVALPPGLKPRKHW
ncbi:hypothetical protein BDN70DRAFT_880431 [Pholiota conissans]|uniref:Aminoglycoside phosphotransferase domain-containing protein n=1 Tax=Pholiota conissans TaxID=109636 RepID=A0A9P5YYI6_9AGAR|nr:hypothetical protein BDN70DRAFT_880431 [Pholiota conissans]